MANNQAIFKAGYHKLVESLQRRWLDSDGKEELKDLITKGMAAYRFNSEISENQLIEIELQLKADLADFVSSFKQRQENYRDSPQFLAMEGALWQWLLAASDRNKLEWLELNEDIKHKGVYHSGDVVGLGHFACQNCKHQLHIYHPEILSSCTECNGEEFNRIPFNP
ncbi:hypothetical protein [Psychrobium sp. 1_MG-2023]|uniref:zinc ribbon-containing protein n=1 Tax=Psychrobium sp. 1_MG-2023 TaxID=3062624 RepID=UPI000C33E70B|nr:hypothetical protein [Psychrobium sp. 1_MG-2023]MDP2560593.1 hypothetical protein [Psychrobium sp. 1_MG-2023]PKF57579.1 hypothetical protein CW748_06745 [Alteromonadales bacterium alter-6D02]